MSEQAEFSLAHYDEAARFVRGRFEAERIDFQPRIGLILGSGLSSLADRIEDAVIIPYPDIPYCPESTVAGHVGRWVAGHLAGAAVCVMQGRFHFYEGYSPAQVTFPVRVMRRLGIETLIVTNAAGGVKAGLAVGDILLIEDHINFVGMAGQNPLMGPNLEEFGPRFPAANRVYTKRLRVLAEQAAAEIGLRLQRGVYGALAGPNFETAAEVRMLRSWGVDAVGMSTVPEALVAHHAGMEVLAFSTITNVAIDELDAEGEPSHEEVTAAGRVIVPRMSGLVMGVLGRLAEKV